MRSITIQVRRKGVITLPRELREQYHLAEGDVFTLIDLGDGSFLFTPRVSKVAALGDEIAKILNEDEVSLDDLLATLDREREEYYREHYAGA